jgi:ribose transport system substrate-binding protein
MRGRRTPVWRVAAVAACVLLAACGAGNEPEGTAAVADEDTPAPADPTPPEGTEDAQEQPADDDEINVEPRTIGVMNIAGAANAAITIMNDTRAAAEALGWEVDECDGQGDPQLISSCVVTLVQRNPDAIITMSAAPAAIQDGLELAAERGIPVINFGGEVEDKSPFAAEFVPDDTMMSNLLTQRLIDDLDGGPAEIGVFYSDANYAQRLRGVELQRMLDETDITIAASVQSTYTNPFEESARDAEAMLRANPNIAAFWASSGSFNLAGIAETLVSQDRLDVKAYGYFCEPILQDMIREGQITAILCVTLGKVGWDAMDALVRYFESDQPLGSQSAPVDYRYEVLDETSLDRANSFFEGYQEEYLALWRSLY